MDEMDSEAGHSKDVRLRVRDIAELRRHLTKPMVAFNHASAKRDTEARNEIDNRAAEAVMCQSLTSH